MSETCVGMIMIQGYGINAWEIATDDQVEAYKKAKESIEKTVDVGDLGNRFFTFKIIKNDETEYYLYNNNTRVGRKMIQLPLHNGAFRNAVDNYKLKKIERIKQTVIND